MAATGIQSTEEGMGSISEINVTPLVDVVLVLLIIMMVAAPMIVNNPSIKVDLPKASSGTDTPKSVLSVTLAKQTQGAGYLLLLNGTAIAEAALRVQVGVEVAKNPDIQVVITGDRGVPYGDVMHVIDLVKQVGVHRFAMVTDGT